MKSPARWFWVLLLVPILLGLMRLRFDVEVLNLLPADSAAVQGLKLYQQQFANARELIITLRAQDPEITETAARIIAENLRPKTNLVASVTWQPPWLEHPGDSGELVAYLWFNQPPEIFGQLTNRLDPTKLPALLGAAREELSTSLSPGQLARLSYDPFGLTQLPEGATGGAPAFESGQEMFASPDGTLRLLFIQANQELPTYRECARWLTEIKQSVAIAISTDEKLPSSVRLGYTGRPAFVAEISAGMQHDINLSVGGTALIIAVLFWLAHRRWKPMLWLLTLLAMILGSTLALGALIFGTINVVSMGFAAILLGLAVDYAVVHYQEALAHPNLSVPEVRRLIAPSIFWAAVTTITAFLVLNFGGLPGLAQLGSLVGLGVALSACIMIFAFLPPLFPERRKPRVDDVGNVAPATPSDEPAEKSTAETATPARSRWVAVMTFLLLLLCACVLLSGFPSMDSTAEPLRLRNSSAYAALEDVKSALNQNREPLWLLVSGRNAEETARTLDGIQPVLDAAISNNVISRVTLPSALWPRPQSQVANRVVAGELVARRALLRQAALAAGFAESSLALSENILNTWQVAAASTPPFWPTNQMSQWIFQKFMASTPTNYLVLGLLQPATNSPSRSRAGFAQLASELPRKNVWLSGWELLGDAIFAKVKTNLWKLVTPMVLLVLLSLWLAFRRWQELALSVIVLALSGACLLTVMRFANWRWNLLNLMGLPLILGTGVDYSIFMLLALRRYRGDLKMAHRSVGRALLLCGATATTGFGSLGFSSNAGMASLGQVCAVGIAGNMLIAIFLLPDWWRKLIWSSGNSDKLHGRAATSAEQNSRPTTPSSLYRSEFWRLAMWVARRLPRRVCFAISYLLTGLYWLTARRRRQVVIENLLPILANERAAVKMGRSLLHQFGLKLVDLFRYEAGLPIDELFGESTGWEHFEAARREKRGVLLVTIHLGDWEFGAPWLARHGIPLQVITLAEPGADFTQLRQASRARANIDTMVIGDDPFAFVEIIRRLEADATVALLVDRPPAPTAVSVQLFGRPFRASIAAAELARASGCVLLPVYLPRVGNTYSAHVLPSIPYDRPALRDREARRQLTQKILSAFEPAIRQHLDQWYHFVPLWPSQ